MSSVSTLKSIGVGVLSFAVIFGADRLKYCGMTDQLNVGFTLCVVMSSVASFVTAMMTIFYYNFLCRSWREKKDRLIAEHHLWHHCDCYSEDINIKR